MRPLVCCALLFPILAAAQPALPNQNSTTSVSGQFVIIGNRLLSPLFVSPPTNAEFIRLEPTLLAVSAERIKQVLLQDLGVGSRVPWRGKIFLELHPASSLNEEVTIVSQGFSDGWNYHVALPDVLSRTRFVRAMTAVVLLEFANRGAGAHAAEVPAWLADGLSQQLLATGAVETVLSLPLKTVNGFPESRTDTARRGIDPLAGAREVLLDHPALTFQQLCWPTDAQLSGADDGVYRASAQLFVSQLLKIKDGPAKLRAMLQISPHYYNWQTAFQNAFSADFAQPLDVEKWWALQAMDFIARNPGPRWTLAVSCEKLGQILDVAVDLRTSSNALPVHANVSLQAVIRNFDPAQRSVILQARLRELELAQLRMATPLAVLTAEYRAAIADYLSGNTETVSSTRLGKVLSPSPQNAGAQVIVQKLDALDARRRAVESAAKPVIGRP